MCGADLSAQAFRNATWTLQEFPGTVVTNPQTMAHFKHRAHSGGGYNSVTS
jgi:hypothetical protein